MIGKKVKEQRLSRNMTLKDLGYRTGLSASHLSQFERGENTLSMHSLERVAEALDMQLAYFLDTPSPHEGFFRRSYDFNPVDISYDGRIHNRLENGLPESEFEPMTVMLLPQQRGEDSYPKPHQGEEFIYILEGVLTVLINDKEYILYPGDSMHYLASSPHEWLNLTSKIVWLVSVTTPRILSTHALSGTNEVNPKDD